jgi:hypothetical protein
MMMGNKLVQDEIHSVLMKITILGVDEVIYIYSYTGV